MGGKHICNPSYDATGTCKFCGFKPCSCDEKHPHFKAPVVERIFFQRRPIDAPRLASAAAAGGVRGAWRPVSAWGRESVLRSLIDLALNGKQVEVSDASELTGLD
jgi:hypothetical protein